MARYNISHTDKSGYIQGMWGEKRSEGNGQKDFTLI